MKLITVKNWELQASEETWGLIPFKTLLERDKTKEKEIANKELLFIFFYCDIKSDYINMPPHQREEEIKKDVGLPEEWVIDDDMRQAIDLYEKLTSSIIQKLYKQAIKSASDVGDYLENTKKLLEERDANGKPVTDISKITASIQRVPKLMSDLKAAYSEVIKEQESTEGRKKGSQTMNTFEDGLKFD